MQFYAPYFLNLLWLAPILVLCFIGSGWISYKRVREFLKTKEIQEKLLPHYEKREWPIRAIFLLAAFIFSVIALSQPQWGEEKKKIERKGVDVIFMLDVSTSMLAEDTKPSRVRKAKFEIESFVKELKGDRIGMLTFAGTSFMQTPLTLDYSAFLIFLSGVDVGHVPDPGTSLGPAIQKAISAFPDEKGKHRALIVFSDGEDHEIQIEPAIEEAKKKNVRIYTIGTATAEGAPIPLKNEQGIQSAVKKDRAGNIVITKLNKDILSKVSTETGGIYLPATPSEREVALILKHLTTLGVKKLEDRMITEREDHYQVFLLIAILCLMLEMLVRRGKSPRMMPLSALVILFILHSGFISTSQEKVSKGNQDFAEKKYQSAVEKYREVQVKNPDSPPVEYNLATSLYKIDQYQEAAAHLKNAVDKSKQDPELQAKAAYNYGNALYRVGDYDGAIESYKKALEINPKDEDSKYNLEFLLNKKDKFEKENQDRKKDQPNQKNNQNKQDKQKDQKNQGGGGSSQDKNESSGGQKNDKNQGGGSGQDKNQGDKNQDQKGQGQQNQNKDQGGQGQNQGSAGQNQDPNQKDQGQGQNQTDQKQDGNQSDPSKDQNKDAGGKGAPDQKENQNQNEKNKGDQQGKNQNKDQPDQNQDKGSDQNNKENQGGNSKPEQNKDPQSGGAGDKKSDQNPPQSPKDNQNKQGEQPSQKPQEKDPNSQNPGSKPQQNQPQGKDPGQKPGSGAAGGSNQSGEKGQQGSGVGGKPLQGQMSKEDAEYLLNSLEDGEKKFHVLRKPATESSEAPYVEKDW